MAARKGAWPRAPPARAKRLGDWGGGVASRRRENSIVCGSAALGGAATARVPGVWAARREGVKGFLSRSLGVPEPLLGFWSIWLGVLWGFFSGLPARDVAACWGGRLAWLSVFPRSEVQRGWLAGWLASGRRC